ncbi:xyloglucan endotransglucosylase/hydrolase protein 2 [Coffea arabica]|uniref:Xyloglucan endotransglucosylase/hydrolase n=1 Tax=Coffea arabica TaxID=13443 RepID=A0A6P6UY79_COFAR|nr:xyloglucan endotransglucosylase/hydrolase protein 2-like [Coffea arabica]
MDYLLIIFPIVFVAAINCAQGNGDDPFYRNYYQTWGGSHLTVYNQGHEVQLLMDSSSGAGFSSKRDFGSGYFRMKIKIPEKNSKGLITSFYLISVPVGQPVEGVKHYEFDIEFYGTDGNPHIISTNAFANDLGNREQQFHLWFDPTKGFHTYEILWNQHQIVWFVDDTPIRVWKNNTQLGVGFPTGPLHVEASIWNPSYLGTPDWYQGPFKAHYREFGIDGCNHQSSKQDLCSSQSYYWNQNKYWQLDPKQQGKLQNARKNYMYKDYCKDSNRHGPECQVNQ